MTEVKISEFLRMLKEGKTSKEIQEHYGLSTSAMIELRKHPKLKGVRSRPKPSFVVVDDTEDETTETINPSEPEPPEAQLDEEMSNTPIPVAPAGWSYDGVLEEDQDDE